MKVRPAVVEDVDQIMVVEQESFGDHVGPEGMATRETMIERIKLVNGNKDHPDGFFVAESYGPYGLKPLILGYTLVQLTALSPEECVSWDVATDSGTLRSTHNPDAEVKHMFGVSLGVRVGAPRGTVPLLVSHTFLSWAQSGAVSCMFCSRMPGYARMRERIGCTPENYIALRRSDGTYRDPMLQMYAELTSGKPQRILRNGYEVDADSGGHGVLFLAEEPFVSLSGIVHRIYEAGQADGRAAARQRPGEADLDVAA